MFFPGLLMLVVFLAMVYLFYRKWLKSNQLAFIQAEPLPKFIRDKIAFKYTHLTDTQLSMVMRALRDYFWMCNVANRKQVSMPSQVVDEAWHAFILNTRAYQHYCQRALGRFLHHTPAEGMISPVTARDGIKRAWRLACAKESINARSPERLPAIFAIDALLNIPDGFKYSINCRDKNSPGYADGYCAGHIGCSSGCAGGSGSASATDTSGCSGDGGGCGGGD